MVLRVGGARCFNTGLVVVCEVRMVVGRGPDVGREGVCEIVVSPQMISESSG